MLGSSCITTTKLNENVQLNTDRLIKILNRGERLFQSDFESQMRRPSNADISLSTLIIRDAGFIEHPNNADYCAIASVSYSMIQVEWSLLHAYWPLVIPKDIPILTPDDALYLFIFCLCFSVRMDTELAFRRNTEMTFTSDILRQDVYTRPYRSYYVHDTSILHPMIQDLYPMYEKAVQSEIKPA